MRYCKKCLLPSTKPYIKFDKYGVCEACLFHENKKNITKKGINWKKKEKDFNEIIKRTKLKKAKLFDVCVPVSGGKDSIAQVSHLLNRGLRILCVNVDYGIKTKIGHNNLECISKMGANLIIYRSNLIFHKKIIKISFQDFGDPDLMSHCLLYSIPIRIAINLKIPLVLLGENSAYEYSGDDSFDEKSFNFRWFKYYVSSSGITPKKFSKIYNIPYNLLKLYDLPVEKELKKTMILFSSYFFKWSSEKNLKIAKKYGFKTLNRPAEGTYRNYVSIDEKINRIHHYIKLLKFGYGRATDHACEDIRNKLISRKKGILLVKKYDRVKLTNFFINDFVDFIGIKRSSFFKTLSKFTNKKIWKKKKLFNLI
jgi:N-acetyl sugar amidotransferase|tara:strand:- start:2309 stop:3409 length:1101 start_codon:yes stop_codon:yes gene_type:complete